MQHYLPPTYMSELYAALMDFHETGTLAGFDAFYDRWQATGMLPRRPPDAEVREAMVHKAICNLPQLAHIAERHALWLTTRGYSVIPGDDAASSKEGAQP